VYQPVEVQHKTQVATKHQLDCILSNFSFGGNFVQALQCFGALFFEALVLIRALKHVDNKI
jgi:hypothetical protein